MKDSCRPRKLDAGFAAMYSKSSVLSTSTMKSEPGSSTVRTSRSTDSGAVSDARPRAASSGVTGVAAERRRYREQIVYPTPKAQSPMSPSASRLALTRRDHSRDPHTSPDHLRVIPHG